MKKKIFVPVSAALIALLFFAGCQKSITEVTEESAQTNLPDAKLKNQCQLTFGYDGGGFPNWFHYNNKGLADEWRIDFGSGIPDIITMAYDDNNKLSHAWWHYDGVLISTFEFVWTGNRITTEHWGYVGFPFDIVNTYDNQNRIVKRETSYGFWAGTDFTPEGNHLRDVVYFDVDPVQSDDYTYTQPNKNPFQAISGLPYAFLYINPYQSRWYATSDKFSVFENGSPVLYLDTDPAQTVMQLGFQDYLSDVTYFDNVSGTFMERNFEYQNCGPQGNAAARVAGSSSSPNLSAGKKTNRHAFLLGSPDQVKKQIEKMRKKN